MQWREIVADVAAILSTPLPIIEDMDWDDVLLWHREALRIHKARA